MIQKEIHCLLYSEMIISSFWNDHFTPIWSFQSDIMIYYEMIIHSDMMNDIIISAHMRSLYGRPLRWIFGVQKSGFDCMFRIFLECKSGLQIQQTKLRCNPENGFQSDCGLLAILSITTLDVANQTRKFPGGNFLNHTAMLETMIEKLASLSL